MDSKEQQVMEARFVLPYNWLRPESSRHWRQKHGIWSLAKKLVGDLEGKVVLDAGCGDGWYAARMLEAKAHTYGCDFSGRAISFAKIIVSEVEFKEGSLLQLPYEDDFFDVVFSFQVLEHIPPADLPQAIKEIARVLKSGGVFIASVPTHRRPFSTAHFQHFTESSIADVLDPEFVLEKNVGQECYTSILKIIERILDNRYWLLHKLAIQFNRGMYMKKWNEGPAAKGHNFVVRSIKNG